MIEADLNQQPLQLSENAQIRPLAHCPNHDDDTELSRLCQDDSDLRRLMALCDCDKWLVAVQCNALLIRYLISGYYYSFIVILYDSILVL